MRSTFTAIAFFVALPAFAANDDVKFESDKLSFPVNIKGKLDRDQSDICIPHGTTLRGMSDLTQQGLKVRLANVFGNPIDCTNPSANKTIPAGEQITISEADVKNARPSRYGLTFGGLVVPFKYHLNGDKEFRPGSTVAPYIGYRFDKNTIGASLKLVGFLGGAGVSVEQTVDGQSKTQTLAGLSYGLSLIAIVKGDFQIGLVVGADKVSKSANYANNGRTWVAVGVGFNFTE
jgi:hypothetical protein